MPGVVRSIQKLPGQGESEFLHWDMNPFAPSTKASASSSSAAAASAASASAKSVQDGALASASGSAASEESEPASSGVCGKVCYTASRFVAVLGSHTAEFHRDFVSKYKDIYPKVKPNAPKFGLDAKKDDPLQLWKQQKEYAIPAGCVVFW